MDNMVHEKQNCAKPLGFAFASASIHLTTNHSTRSHIDVVTYLRRGQQSAKT